MSSNLQRRDQEAVSHLRTRVEAEFPDLDVFIESWDHGERVRGHVVDSKSGHRLDLPEGLLVSYSDEDLARIVLSYISRWKARRKNC